MHILFLILQASFSLFMLKDAIRRDSSRYWWLVIMLPFGELLYFFTVKLPEDKDVQAIGRKLFPEKPPSLKHLRSAYRRTPSLENKTRLAQRLYDDGAHDEANTLFSEILGRNPDDKEALYGYALCALSLGDRGIAIAALERLIALDFSYSDYAACHELADAYWTNGQSQQAIALMRRAHQQSSHPEASRLLARYLSDDGHLREAIKLLSDTLDYYDTSPRFIKKRLRRSLRAVRALLKKLTIKLAETPILKKFPTMTPDGGSPFVPHNWRALLQRRVGDLTAAELAIVLKSLGITQETLRPLQERTSSMADALVAYLIDSGRHLNELAVQLHEVAPFTTGHLLKIVIDAEIEEVSLDYIDELLNIIRQRTGDTTATCLKLDRGSSILTITLKSHESINTVTSVISELQEILNNFGLEIIDIYGGNKTQPTSTTQGKPQEKCSQCKNGLAEALTDCLMFKDVGRRSVLLSQLDKNIYNNMDLRGSNSEVAHRIVDVCSAYPTGLSDLEQILAVQEGSLYSERFSSLLRECDCS